MAHLLTLKRTAHATLVALAVLAALPPAFAQSAPPYPAARQPGGDPPGRVARLDYLSGAVTTEPAGTDSWAYAAVNRPLTTGDQLWNDAGARSELHIGSTAVRLGDSTSVSILNLDDTTTQLKVGLGTLSTHVRSLPQGASYEIDTPNLALGITGPGDYRVDVAPNGQSTTVTMRRGSATVYGDNGQFPLSPGQQIVFTGTNLQVAQQSPAPGLDPLDQWAAGRDAAEDRSVSARYVSRDIPGYEDLDANGAWRQDPTYGAVWVPSDVPQDWAPYHDGHWIWQAPWGWTWVDDQPWGFAPYHYGRWAYVDDSWAWVPGPVAVSEPPVYAPALVAFVGEGGEGPDWNVALTVGGVAAAGCAWFALGPGEAWHPGWGGWSPHYYDRVNRNIVVNNVNVTNITNINNIHNTYINYRAPHAITAVPATAFVHGQPVARFAQHVDPQQWRNARVMSGAPGIAPVRQSFTGELRNAAFRPPAAIAQRPVIATRNPVVPAAYRDQAAAHLAAQGAARVPGAGAPVVKTTAPPDYTPRPVRVPGNPQGAHWAMRDVQLVNPHGPVVQPSRAPEGRPGTPAPAFGAAQRLGNGALPNVPRPMNGEAPRANVAPGLPHPPALGNAPEAHAQMSSPSPSWMQPHAPIERQRAQSGPSGAPQTLHPPGQNALPPVRSAAPEMPAPRQAEIPHPQPHADYSAPRPQPQPRPDYSAPAPRPRPEYSAPAPRPEYSPPRMEPRPSMPAPRMEAPHPAPAPRMEAPRMEAPRPAPAPRMEAPHNNPPPQQHENSRDDRRHA
ncbi:DUF6600 domain-containing protein [Burkholderia guangdongensis]|uniref:DUF6600 domain-containing protein n=1 Tax=Burkholderia guangdongensis TaxID=1792500 RepID=UPI0015CCCF80|nr:DUF6600 domain-containing protein [Burkholderia guangdongensis]